MCLPRPSRPTPTPDDRFAWGSRSISSVSCPRAAREAARLMAVVVLPTPPFWFATAMTRAMGLLFFLQIDLPRRGRRVGVFLGALQGFVEGLLEPVAFGLLGFQVLAEQIVAPPGLALERL